MPAKKNNYYIVDKEEKSLWMIPISILKIVFSLPKLLISFLFSRVLAHVTLNPTNVRTQKPIHLVYIYNDNDKSNVIVNLLPRESYKFFKDYLLKFAGSIFNFPFSESAQKYQLSFDNPDDVAHIDRVLEEIDKLLTCSSESDKCKNKKFELSDLHFKGLAGLDAPLQHYFYEKLYEKYSKEDLEESKTIAMKFFSLETPDYAVLDSVEVTTPNESEKAYKNRRYIVTCMARDQNYVNWIKDFNRTAMTVGCTVIGFNYRGIDYSKGIIWTEADLVNDTVSQVKRLIELGVNPENIGLEGTSIGGAVATLAAAKLHNMGIKVYVNNERSFRSIIRFITGYIMPEPNCNRWNPLNWLKYTFAGICYVTLAPILKLVRWSMDIETAWDDIPVEYKEYSVARHFNAENPIENQDDGVVHDTWASIASYEDEKRRNLLKRKQAGKTLSDEELLVLDDQPRLHYFRVDNDYKDPSNRLPHHIPRSHLVNTIKGLDLHQYAMNFFHNKFPKTTEEAANEPEFNLSDDLKRPLFISNSEGIEHNSAIVAIMHQLKTEFGSKLIISKHQAIHYDNKPFSWRALGIKIVIFTLSLWGIGTLLGHLLRLLGYPNLPSWTEFENELIRLKRVEAAEHTKVPQGKYRPYIDLLLDMDAAGYEATAIVNSMHSLDNMQDLNQLHEYKTIHDRWIYQNIYESTLTRLINAAENGRAFTEIISTQTSGLDAICDAIDYYNENYLARENTNRKIQSQIPLPRLTLHHYMTDLPSINYNYSLDILGNLTPKQQSLIHVHTVNLSQPLQSMYFNDSNFHGVHSAIDPKDNPMVKMGFKEEQLSNYLNKNTDVEVCFNAHEKNMSQNWVEEVDKHIRTIPAHAKVASIKLNPHDTTAAIKYLDQLLKSQHKFNTIFLFNGLEAGIQQALDQLIATYPEIKRLTLREKIICLGNQDDRDIAAIMTRSDCLILRGTGKCCMEQLALPEDPSKSYYFHTDDNQSGINREEGNIANFKDYFKDKPNFVERISPEETYGAFDKQPTDYSSKNPVTKPKPSESPDFIYSSGLSLFDISSSKRRTMSASNLHLPKRDSFVDPIFPRII